MIHRFTAQWIGACCALASLTGCSVAIAAGRPSETPSHALVVSDAANARCMHGVPGIDSPYREALPGAVTDPELLPFVAGLDPAVRRTALAAGLEPLIAHLLQEQERSPEPSIQALTMRLELNERVVALETRLTAMEFEVDCVRNLLHDVLNVYAESETDRQLDLTIASLVVGAVAGVAAGGWDLANARADEPFFEDGPLLTSIAGAVITTALGIGVISPKERPIVYLHERNVLSPIRDGEDPQLVFPTFVFRMLTLPTIDGGATPRDEMLARWNELMAETVAPEERTLAEAILYGEGGVYDPQLLTLHENLLEQMGATLDAFAGDIDILTRALAILLRPRVAPDAAPVQK